MSTSRVAVQDLGDGLAVDEIYWIVERQVRVNRNAALYLQLELRDKTGSITGRMWNVTEEGVAGIKAGEAARIKGKVQLFQGALQLILTQVTPVPPGTVAASEFLPKATKDTAAMFVRLAELLRGQSDPALKTLAECFLADQQLMEAFCRAPAGVRAHHAYQGGLLEHVLNMTEIADRCRDLLVGVSPDLLRMGIFLHDLGKVRELTYDGALGYSDEGQLLGHLALGVEMLSEKLALAARQLGGTFPRETEWRLKHMILSHHGTYEFGSPKLPMTPEAIALHCIDNLDAKVHEFHREITEDPGQGSGFTPYHARLDRKLFKGLKEGGPTAGGGTAG
jgi:3'-5' exoribonuclease